MRVVILGSTGLLGRATERRLRSRDIEVTGVSRSGPVRLDVVAASRSDLDATLEGADAVVYALGPDDRTRPPKPADAFFHQRLVEPTRRVAESCARTGVTRLVVLGSYFTTFDRREPHRRLAERHPYIQARREQAAAAIRTAGDSVAVSVLEIPFVFADDPGPEPVWKANFFDQMLALPLPMPPRGSSAAVTDVDVATAVESLLTAPRPQPWHHPIATDNVTYRRMAELLVDELGVRGFRKQVRPMPAPLIAIALAAETALLTARGRDSGLDLLRLPWDMLDRDLTLDPTATGRELGLTPHDVEPQIRATARAAYPHRLAQ